MANVSPVGLGVVGGGAFGTIVGRIAAGLDEVDLRMIYARTPEQTRVRLGESLQDLAVQRGTCMRQVLIVGSCDEDSIDRRVAQQRIEIAHDWNASDLLVYLLSAANRLGDVEAARQIAPLLEPVKDSYCIERECTVGRQLGLAALLLGEPAKARDYFEQALELATRLRDRPEVARTHFALARVLFEHHPEEKAEAAEHLSFALGEFQAMKMQPSLEEAMRLRLQNQGISSTSGDIYTSIVAVAESVQRERPDMAAHAAPDGTVTIMFSDIEDSTVLTERLGDEAWQALLRKHNALIREQLRAHDGYEVKTMGDGFMVAFRSAKKGLDCAMAIQRAFDTSPPIPASASANGESRVRVRIGLHAGEAIKDGDDFYGKNVILASRVAGKAAGGEILVSSLVRQLVESSVDSSTFADSRDVELKGLAGQHTIHAVRWAK